MALDMLTEQTLESPGTRTEKTPRPTYAPFLLALGITMLFWGVTTSWVMSAGGTSLFIGAAWMWIRDIAQTWSN